MYAIYLILMNQAHFLHRSYAPEYQYRVVQLSSALQMKHSLVRHLLSIPAEGAVEWCWLFTAQSLPETTVELTEAPQTRDKLPARHTEKRNWEIWTEGEES